ncbi:MAG: hypothetical protein NVS4B8_28240 [Herpetosiphon sp.]
MTATTAPTPASAEQTTPAWAVATLFPAQGQWSEEDYLLLPTNHLVEFSHGQVEVLPMPSQLHQLIVLFLYRALYDFVSGNNLGVVLVAPMRVQLWPGKIREPDVAVMRAVNALRRHDAYWEAADLVIEVVSPDDPQRDLVTKRREYAQAGIPEYWIVDPQAARVTVLQLEADRYVEHGVCRPGMRATSLLLPGFAVEVDRVFAVAAQ